jgi:hypothetical protein
MDFSLKSEIRSGLERTKKLLDSKIMWSDPTLIFRQSVLIEILINLKDLLIKANKLGHRIAFTDDINPDPTLKITDVTDLIGNFRDAACHSDSYRRKAQESTLSFNEIRGKGILMQINNLTIGSSYEDDIAFNMGQNILYMKRHIERAFNEVEAFLEPISRFP